MKNKSLVIFGSVFVVSMILLVLLVSTYYIGVSNTANRNEKQIEMLHNNSQSELSNYTMTIIEMTKVSDKYKDGLKEIVTKTMEGRYGENGTEAIVSYLKEQNVTLDSQVYLNIQNSIVAGRKDFKNSQNMIMDACAKYKTTLDNVVSGAFLRIAGYPKMKTLESKCSPVTDEKTNKTFDTKKQESVI